MLDRIIYWLALSLIVVIRRLPLPLCYGLGQTIGAVMFAILPGYRKLAKENLSSCFGSEKSPAEILRLTFQHFCTLGANAVCSFRMATLSAEQIAECTNIKTVETEPVMANLRKGRGIVLAINHIGNWELYAQLADFFPETRFGTIYQALRNKSLDDLINADRRRKGVLTFARKDGFDGAISLLRNAGIVGVLVDQSAGNGGIWMPFFHRLSSTSPLASTLAIRTQSAVIPAAIYTTGFARWEIVPGPEIPYSDDKPEQLTADINSALEAQIRQSPADWFWVHNRWKIPHPNFLTATQKRGTWLPPELDPTTLRPFRIVLRSPNWLGDAVMSIRAARAFKTSRPDARLSILTPEKLSALWESVPEVDEVIPFAAGESVFQVAKKLRGRFEVAVLFPNSLRSALEVWLADIPRRVGFHGHFREKLLNQTVRERKKSKKPPRPEHHTDRYWRLAAGCGGVEAPPLPRRHSPKGGRIIGICPGAEYGSAKRWPTENFRAVIEEVDAEGDCSWVILGTAADTPLAQEIMEGLDPSRITDLTGKTSLGELISRLQTLSALVTNDTGTMHLADFLGLPLVAIFGSTEPRLTGPRSPHSIALRQQVECSPCFLRECPIDFRCMKAISPSAVSKSLQNLLATDEPKISS